MKTIELPDFNDCIDKTSLRLPCARFSFSRGEMDLLDCIDFIHKKIRCPYYMNFLSITLMMESGALMRVLVCLTIGVILPIFFSQKARTFHGEGV